MEFPLSKFRIFYKSFADVSNEEVEAYAESGLSYINSGAKKCDCFGSLWQLMTAHLLQLARNIEDGDDGIVASASIDKVAVSYVAPNSATPIEYWYNKTPYGQDYQVLLRKCVLPIGLANGNNMGRRNG